MLCCVESTIGRSSANVRRSPLTAYDRAGNVTRFEYGESRYPHYLTTVIDPLGHTRWEVAVEKVSTGAPAIDAGWKDVPHRLGTNAIPLIEGCAAWLECTLVDVHAVGDHDVCIGEVTSATAGTGDPLILWDRAFWTLR